MENASKALLIAGAVLIAIVIIASAIAILGNGANSGKDAEKIGGEISLSTQETTEQIQAGLNTLQNGNKEEIKITAINLRDEEYAITPDDFSSPWLVWFAIENVLSIEPKNATNKNLEWSCKDKYSEGTGAKVTSDGEEIEIEFQNPGTVIITATATDGSEISNSFEVTLYSPVCFVAGTKVLGESGYVNIEDIKEGDYIYTINLDNNQRELKQVEKTIISKTNKIFELTIGDEIVEATPRHQFYIVDKGWIRAYNLEVGDELVSKEEKLVISNIKGVEYEEPITVYNLKVEGNHNYLVTKYEMLVHNAASSSEGV